MKNYTYNFLKYLCENNLIKITDIYHDDTKDQTIISYLEINSVQRITTITLPSYDIEKIYELLNMTILPITTITESEDLDMIINPELPTQTMLLEIFTLLEKHEMRPKYYQYYDDSAIITLDNNYVHKIKNILDFNEISDLHEWITECL